MRPNSIYTRLFVVFFLILSIQAATLTAIFSWSRGAVEKELNEAAASNVIYLRDGFVSNVELIQYQLQCLVENSAVGYYYVYRDTRSPVENYIAIRDVQRAMSNVYVSNPYITQLWLYYVPINVYFGTCTVGTVTDGELEKKVADFRSQGMLLTKTLDETQKPILAVEYMLPITKYASSGMPTYFLRAVLNDQQVINHLSSFSAYDNENAFMIHQDSQSVYASSGSIDCAKELLALPWEEDKSVAFQKMQIGGRAYIAVGCFAPAIGCRFIQLIDSARLNHIPSRLQAFIVLFGLLALGLLMLYAFFTYRMVNRPINDLLRAFDGIGAGNMNTHLHRLYSDEFNRLAANFNHMTDRLQTLIQNNYEQTIRLQSAEMKQMQAQINPHFLYNSFYLLNHLIEDEEKESAAELTRYLGDYFQYVTDQKQDTLPLEKEYGHAVTYVRIQLMRFGCYASAEIDPVPDEIAGLSVPRLILQPVLENAMEYGVRTSEETSLIRLFFETDSPGYARVVVEDNGDSLTDADIAALSRRITGDEALNSHALSNIHRRLQIFFGDGCCGLSVSRAGLGGLRVCLTLRMRKEEKSNG